jgi:hypothetical protein
MMPGRIKNSENGNKQKKTHNLTMETLNDELNDSIIHDLTILIQVWYVHVQVVFTSRHTRSIQKGRVHDRHEEHRDDFVAVVVADRCVRSSSSSRGRIGDNRSFSSTVGHVRWILLMLLLVMSVSVAMVLAEERIVVVVLVVVVVVVIIVCWMYSTALTKSSLRHATATSKREGTTK